MNKKKKEIKNKKIKSLIRAEDEGHKSLPRKTLVERLYQKS